MYEKTFQGSGLCCGKSSSCPTSAKFPSRAKGWQQWFTSWSPLHGGNVFDQGNFENKKPEIGLNEVERQGLVSLQILVYYIVITSQMRLLALIEPAEVIGLANVVTRWEQAVCNCIISAALKTSTSWKSQRLTVMPSQGSGGSWKLKRGNRDDPDPHQPTGRPDQEEECHKRGEHINWYARTDEWCQRQLNKNSL